MDIWDADKIILFIIFFIPGFVSMKIYSLFAPFKDKEDFRVNINSTLMMPSDTPVLTVVDPKNAAMAAIRILALKDEGLAGKVADRIAEIKDSFENK